MDWEEIAAFVFVMTALLGVFTLIGMRLKLKAGERDRDTIPQQDIERLIDAVDHLSDQVGTIANDTADLQERVDFTERMLAAPRERADTPA